MRRAGGYTAQEQIDQLYENSDPDFQLYARIGEITTLPELFRRAPEYETINQRRKDYPKEVKRTPEVNVATVQYDRRTCCWRCKQRGHTRFDCKRPPRKFCSRCGKDGVLTRDCHPRRETTHGSATRRPSSDPLPNKIHTTAAYPGACSWRCCMGSSIPGPKSHSLTPKPRESRGGRATVAKRGRANNPGRRH